MRATRSASWRFVMMESTGGTVRILCACALQPFAQLSTVAKLEPSRHEFCELAIHAWGERRSRCHDCLRRPIVTRENPVHGADLFSGDNVARTVAFHLIQNADGDVVAFGDDVSPP